MRVIGNRRAIASERAASGTKSDFFYDGVGNQSATHSITQPSHMFMRMQVVFDMVRESTVVIRNAHADSLFLRRTAR